LDQEHNYEDDAKCDVSWRRRVPERLPSNDAENACNEEERPEATEAVHHYFTEEDGGWWGWEVRAILLAPFIGLGVREALCVGGLEAVEELGGSKFVPFELGKLCIKPISVYEIGKKTRNRRV
jgi:hypothetical protein